MTDQVIMALIGGAVAIFGGVQAIVIAKINAVKTAADGLNSRLREESAAKDGEINRLQAPDSGLTPQTRLDGSGGAHVTIDRRSKAVTVTPVPPKSE